MSPTTKTLFRIYDLIQNGDANSLERHLTNCTTNINVVLPCKGIGILHLAVGIEPLDKSRQCTEIILRHGGDPNLCSDEGITPVHIAAIWGRLDNLKLLVGCGGEASRRDSDGRSAFDYAALEQQWEVYDYLHNVLDQRDDALGSPCSYKLGLERILVTTGQVVAEYGSVSEDHMKKLSICRKSDMVREWCDKTTLAVNRLYPTILNQTYMLEDESVPWRTGDFTQVDITRPLNGQNLSILNETKSSYKTCFSKKDNHIQLDISGIQELEQTNDEESNCSCSCHESYVKVNKNSQRISVYDNFSLPGSPNSIMHKNYKSKTSLRKCKKKTNSLKMSECNSIITDDTGLPITEDNSNESRSLNDAVAVAQNETNEWLSHSGSSGNSSGMLEGLIVPGHQETTEVEIHQERRSSGSSGVSSSFSSGSVTLASVQEEYKYEDLDEDVVLIEKRLLVPTVVLPIEEEGMEGGSGDKSIHSVASSLPAAVEYDPNVLRSELVLRGFTPGPINSTTQRLYLKKLHSLRKNPILVTTKGKTYSVELERSLRNEDWFEDLTAYIDLETRARNDFSNNSRSWREGTAKTSFTYLLLDPRLTDNLPGQSGQTKHQAWCTFVNSIFYVGKGKRSRPYSHLYQALTLWKRDFTTSKDQKVQHILDIWSARVGVVCLHVFQNVIPAEAYTYEAAMIDVLGVQNLKNLKCGNYYGVASSWPLKERRMLGMYLLYKAMLIFLNEGERQLRPDDID